MRLLSLILLTFTLTTLVNGRSGSFGSIINHVFSCDCFISQTERSSLDELLKPMRTQKMNMNPPFRKNPKLIIIHSKDRRDHQNEAREIIEDSVSNGQKQSAWNPIGSLENIINFLQISQQKLNSWIQSDDSKVHAVNDPVEYVHQDGNEESLFSLEKGSITRNIVRLGRFLQLFDKFDCRCAGNLSSILNAERFVRFTVAHL